MRALPPYLQEDEGKRLFLADGQFQKVAQWAGGVVDDSEDGYDTNAAQAHYVPERRSACMVSSCIHDIRLTYRTAQLQHLWQVRRLSIRLIQRQAKDTV